MIWKLHYSGLVWKHVIKKSSLILQLDLWELSDNLLTLTLQYFKCKLLYVSPQAVLEYLRLLTSYLKNRISVRKACFQNVFLPQSRDDSQKQIAHMFFANQRCLALQVNVWLRHQYEIYNIPWTYNTHKKVALTALLSVTIYLDEASLWTRSWKLAVWPTPPSAYP